MTKDNTPSGETVDEILNNADAWCWCEKDECQQNKQRIQANHSLRQAIEGMVERVIGEEADKHKPPFSQHDYGFMSANAVNDRVSKQRQRAKEELSKLFGKE